MVLFVFPKLFVRKIKSLINKRPLTTTGVKCYVTSVFAATQCSTKTASSGVYTVCRNIFSAVYK